jgi:hypothetical protein
MLGLLFNFCLGWFQSAPGYMDADYYFAGGLRLVQGHGFTETYLWNYLDNPQSLPHPSNGYWFPLASLLAAAGMFLAGQQTFFGARLGFILVAALAAPVTALLSYQITLRRETSVTAGLLAVFYGFYTPYMSTTDNFGLLMLLGGLFFLLVLRRERFASFLLGMLAGLINLSRTDGILWFGLGLGLIGVQIFQTKNRPALTPIFLSILVFIAGYGLVMVPWFARNLSIWGTPLTPAGGSALWLTRYEDTFAWPATRINFSSWMASGWQSIWAARLEALKFNLINTMAIQGEVLLFPFILIGLFAMRKDVRIRLAACGWLLLFIVMSIVFPFAGSRGSFFHAGAALQPIWFVCAVIGLDLLVTRVRVRGFFTPAAPVFFRVLLVVFMCFITLQQVYISLIQSDWNNFYRTYERVEQVLLQNGAQSSDGVIVSNAPGYYVATGRSAINVPDENITSVRRLAQQFGARYLVLEKTYFTGLLFPVYKDPENQTGLKYLGEFDQIRIFAIQP